MINRTEQSIKILPLMQKVISVYFVILNDNTINQSKLFKNHPLLIKIKEAIDRIDIDDIERRSSTNLDHLNEVENILVNISDLFTQYNLGNLFKNINDMKLIVGDI